MHSFVVLLKKELRGNLRTYRLLIVVGVFFVFGLGTPLLLKYLHALVPAEDAGIVIPEFTAVDAVEGFIDTIGQVGLIAAILLAMGAVARERETGTAAMTLSKPVGCGPFIAAKMAALALVFAIALAVGALGCYIYTVILFESLSASNFFSGVLLGGLYLLVCLAVTVMYSSFFRNQLAAGALALVTLIALAATAGLPLMEDYSPGALLPWSQRVASGSGPDAWGALIVSIGVVVLTTVIGWQVFKRKEL